MSSNQSFLNSLSSSEGTSLMLDDGPSSSSSLGSDSMLLPGGISVTEHVVNILKLLRDQPGRIGLTLAEIDQETGVKSQGNIHLIRSLQTNEKIHFDQITQRYSYKARFAADDLYGLLRLLRNHERGLRLKDVEDAYPGAAKDLAALTRNGGLEALFSTTMGHLLSIGPSSSGRAGGASSSSSATSAVAAARQAVLSSNAVGLMRFRNDDRDVGDIVRVREPLIR
jgi:TFIIE beta subunit core domain